MTPRLIRANPAAQAEYEAAMARAWAAKNRLLALGVPLEFALYVLPNAKVIRFVESGPLIALLHKWTMRTCFNAQEEIYVASMEEVEQVRAVHPRLTRFIGPPCVVRNGLISPRCTEGTKFCGVPVWRDFPNAVRPAVAAVSHLCRALRPTQLGHAARGRLRLWRRRISLTGAGSADRARHPRLGASRLLGLEMCLRHRRFPPRMGAIA